MALNNFSWVIPRKLAGSDLPGGCGTKDGLREDVSFLASEGVRVLVSLARPAVPLAKACAEAAIEWRCFPIPDFGVPSGDGSFCRLVDECVGFICADRAVCIHCHAGIGRTGMVLSCIVGVYFHLDAQKAVAAVRAVRQAVETREQCSFITGFLKSRNHES